MRQQLHNIHADARSGGFTDKTNSKGKGSSSTVKSDLTNLSTDELKQLTTQELQRAVLVLQYQAARAELDKHANVRQMW